MDEPPRVCSWNERIERTDRARAGGRGADSDAKTKTFVSFERRLSPLENWDGGGKAGIV